MEKKEILQILKKIDSVYRVKPRDDEELIEAARVWLDVLGKYSYDNIYGALVEYIKSVGAHPPRPAELINIYESKKQAEKADKQWGEEGRCVLCNNENNAIVNLINNKYPCLAIQCPHLIPQEFEALKKGLRITKKIGKRIHLKKTGESKQIYIGKLTYWLENNVLVGKLEKHGNTKPTIQENPKQEDSDLPWTEDLLDEPF